jgi:uncharacterized protein YdcH (DUF465 family)
MEFNNQDELKAHLMATDEQFRRLANEHAQYAQQLDRLEAMPHLSDQDQIEEVRLKKLKLRAKDQMMQIMSRYKAEHVS